MNDLFRVAGRGFGSWESWKSRKDTQAYEAWQRGCTRRYSICRSHEQLFAIWKSGLGGLWQILSQLSKYNNEKEVQSAGEQDTTRPAKGGIVRILKGYLKRGIFKFLKLNGCTFLHQNQPPFTKVTWKILFKENIMYISSCNNCLLLLSSGITKNK